MSEQIKSKPKSLISNSMWSMSLTVWQILVTFFLTPFLVKELGVENYGILILIMTISGFMSIMNFGLGDTTLRYVAYYYGKNDHQSINRIISNTFFIFTVISFFSFILLYLLSGNIVEVLINEVGENKNLYIDLIQLLSFTIGVSFLGSAFSSIPQALQRYDITTKVNIINSILYVLGTVYILLLLPSLYNLVLWNLINTIILQIMNIGVSKYLIKDLSLFPKFDKKTFKEVFGFSFFTFLTHVFAMIQNHSDKLLTTSMINTSSLTYLSIPQQLTSKGSQVVDSIGRVLLPKFTSIDDKKTLEKLFIDSTWYLLLLSALIYTPLTIILPDFFTLWISEDFSSKSSYLGQVIVSSFIISGSFSVYASLFNALGKAHYMTIIIFIIGILNLFTNYLLIKNYGFNGLGYAFWITPIIGFVTVLITWKIVLKFDSTIELFKTYVLPIFSIYSFLYFFNTYFKIYIDIKTWLDLVMCFLIILLLLTIVLFSLEFLLNKKSERITKLLKIIGRK